MENKPKPSYILSALILYFGSCAGLWHIGYWSTFEINYFQYLDLTEIIKDFAEPFIQSAGLVIVVFIVQSTLHNVEKFDNPEHQSFGAGRETKIGIKLNNRLTNQIFISVYLLLLATIIILDFQFKYHIIPFLVAFPLSLFLTNKRYFANYVPNADIRSSLFVFIILLPLWSFCLARIHSIKVYENTEYLQLASISQKNNISFNDSLLLGMKILGSSNHNLFISKKDNSEIYIINLDDIHSYSFEKRKE